MVTTLASITLWALGCDTLLDVSCTTEFRSFAVHVLDEALVPQADLQPEATIARTGRRTLTVDSLRQFAAGGWYPIVSDYDKEILRPSGDSVRLRVSNRDVAVTTMYVFDIPGPEQCHVRKVSGPDTVILR